MEPLNDQRDSNVVSNNKMSAKVIVCLILLFVIIILLITALVLVIFLKKTEVIEKIIEIEPEENTIFWNIYGSIISNISYSENGKIINTFKENGENYNESIGNINNGKDYDENKRNIYDLYIPYSATKRKNETNGILLFIHGGSWIEGDKESMAMFCRMYEEMGYITATMSYTLLNGKYKEYNIFRIIDEITACIQNIIEQLKKREFSEDKLKIAIGGYSAGGHLTLLYTYLIKNSPLKIEFAINLCGPASLEPKYYYKLVKFNDTLDNLYLPEIEKALESKRIVRTKDNDSTLLWFMNIFIGQKYSQKDLNEMLLENGKINTNNTKYIEMFNIVSNAFPSNIEDKNKMPTICFYGGNDDVVGVTQFAYLNKKAEDEGKKIIHIYSRYADHNYLNFETENGINALRELNYQINDLGKALFNTN